MSAPPVAYGQYNNTGILGAALAPVVYQLAPYIADHAPALFNSFVEHLNSLWNSQVNHSDVAYENTRRLSGADQATVTGSCLRATTGRADGGTSTFYVETPPDSKAATCGTPPWDACEGNPPHEGYKNITENGLILSFPNGRGQEAEELFRAGKCKGGDTPAHDDDIPEGDDDIPQNHNSTTRVRSGADGDAITAMSLAAVAALLLSMAAAAPRIKRRAAEGPVVPPVSFGTKFREGAGNLMSATTVFAPSAALYCLGQELPAIIALLTSALRKLLEYRAGTPAPPIKDQALRLAMGATAAGLGPDWGSIAGLLFFALQNPPPSPQAFIDSKWWQQILYVSVAAGCWYVIGGPNAALDSRNTQWDPWKRIVFASLEAIKLLPSLSYLKDRLCLNKQLKDIMNKSRGITERQHEIDAIKAVLNGKSNKVGNAKSEGKIKEEKASEFVELINRLEIDTKGAIDGILDSGLSGDKRLEARSKIFHALIYGQIKENNLKSGDKALSDSDFDNKKLGVLLGYTDAISRVLNVVSTAATTGAAIIALDNMSYEGAITEDGTGIPELFRWILISAAGLGAAAAPGTRGEPVSQSQNIADCMRKCLLKLGIGGETGNRNLPLIAEGSPV